MPAEESLLPGETLVLREHPHWWYFFREIVAGLIILGVMVLAVWALSGGALSFLAAVGSIAAVVWLGWSGIRYLRWRRTEFYVTDQRVGYQSGLLSRSGVAIPLERISNVNFSQSAVERLFGTGDLLIESASESGLTVFSNIPDPLAVQRVVYAQIDAASSQDARSVAQALRDGLPAGGTGAGPAAIPSETDVVTQMAQLARLREQGLVTEEEFQAKRQEILGRL